MQKRLSLIMTLVCLLIGTLLFPLTSAAIGEITPTPDTNPDDSAAPTAIMATPTFTPTPLPSDVSPDDMTPDPELSDAEQLIQAAGSALEDGDYNEVLRLTTEALDLDPDLPEAYALRGIAYSNLEQANRAIDDFTRAISLRDYDWTYYLLRGDAYLQAEELNEALLDYGRALAKNPRYYPAYQRRSLLYLTFGDDASSELNDLMAQGISANSEGNYEKAIEHYTDVIDMADGEGEITTLAYYNLGLTYHNQENWTAALDAYTDALDLAPLMHDSYLARGIAYRQNGDLRRAGQDFIGRIRLLEKNTVTDTLTPGDSVEIEMEHGNVFEFTFEGKGGDTVTIAVREDGDDERTDPLFGLLDPDGNPIAGDDDFGGELDSLLENFRLPVDGTYRLVVSHANGGFSGALTVTLD